MATDIIARGMAANAKKSVTALGNKIESEKWIGTKAEWEAVDKSTIKDGTIVYITDDETVILYNKVEMEKIAAQVATDRTAAETAAQTAQAVADSLPDDYTTAVGKIAENTAEIANVKLTDKELTRRVDALFDMGNGITHKFETDSETAYTRAVPTGAKLMSVKSVGGRSIVWNQIFEAYSGTNNGVTVTTEADGTITLNGTAESSYIYFKPLSPAQNKVGKYILKLLILNNPDSLTMRYAYFNRTITTPAVDKGTVSVLVNQTATDIELQKVAGISGFTTGTVFTNVKIKVQIFDLTQMFGIGNEPSTVEEFEKMFPAEYYPYNAGEIVSAGTEEVAVGDTAHKIPEAIKALPGYGWSVGTARNYVDYENKKYYKCVDSMDLGTVNWQVETSPTFGTYFSTFVDSKKFKKIGDFTQKRHNILCDKYLTVKRDVKEYVDKTILLDGTVSIVTQIQVKDSAYTDATAFKQAMQGVILYYELEKPIVTDISNLIDDDFLRNLTVEAGGSITFKNSNGDSYRIPVPNEEEYIVKLSEVGGTT